VHDIGRFLGDEEPIFLVTNWNRLYLIDETMEIRWETRFSNRITDTTVFPAEDGTARIGVVANDFYLLSPGSPKGIPQPTPPRPFLHQTNRLNNPKHITVIPMQNVLLLPRSL
jgi:hypothetical protein